MRLKYVDETHAYFLDGKRCKSVTTVAKIPDDLYRLQMWEKRQVAIGLATSSDLLEAVAAHVDDDDYLNGLCEKAKELAGANRGSRRGTAAHRVTERHDQGQDVIQTPLATSIVAGWSEILTAAGLEVIPEFMERVVVYPKDKICGKFDRIARTAKGRLVILDLKSGARAIDYPHSAAVQLALYANAPLLAGPLNLHGETETFEPMPDVDKRFGVLIHLPEDGPARAVKLDIAEGWRAAQECCFPTLWWRSVRRDMLVQPLAEVKPAKAVLDEGATLTDFEVDRLRKDFKNCPTKAAVDVWLKQSIEGGKSFHPTAPHGIPSERRAAIIRAAIAWSGYDEDIVRAAFGLLGYDLQLAVKTGVAFGALTIEEACRFVLMADTVSVRFRDDGTPVVAVA